MFGWIKDSWAASRHVRARSRRPTTSDCDVCGYEIVERTKADITRMRGPACS